MTARILIAVGLLCALVAVAQAEPAADLEPAGTRVVRPDPRPGCTAEDGCDGQTVTRTTVRLAVTRESAERAMAAHDVAETRLQEWLECEARAERLVSQPSPMWTAVKWTALGVAIGGAFALGVVAAR